MPPYKLAPILSDADPREKAEGTLDPLSLEAIADSLATRLAPGVRERQHHPRFLTAIAVALSLCRDFDPDTLAQDGVSEPWQVFEWYMVEGLTRKAEDPAEISGLPGSMKARQALADRVPLCATRYLVVPSVFGFHGVYRRLARELHVEDSERLGELGYELLCTWETEQNLEGFHSGRTGPGSPWRKCLLDAIKDGLTTGATDRSGNWSGWEFFRDHLSIYNAGPLEKQVITNALYGPKESTRYKLLNFLTSPGGKEALWKDETKSKIDERRFHQSFYENTDQEVKYLLDTIFVYEVFARNLADAFDACRHQMTLKHGKTIPGELSNAGPVRRAAAEIPALFSEASRRLGDFGEALRFHDLFESFAEPSSPTEFVRKLIDHHRKVQKQKPPNGKNPWIELFDDGAMVIRPGYQLEEPVNEAEDYLHFFRTNPLWSFACDLGLIDGKE